MLKGNKLFTVQTEPLNPAITKLYIDSDLNVYIKTKNGVKRTNGEFDKSLMGYYGFIQRPKDKFGYNYAKSIKWLDEE